MYDVALHLGTLVAVVVYFARAWIDLLLGPSRRLFWFLVAATIPGGLAGLTPEHYAESTLRNPYVIASTMIGVALFLWWAERKSRFEKELGQVTLADSVAIGAAQALAVVPGTSRSGVTIAAALARDLNRPAAAMFSFLLATPIIAGAVVKAAWNIHHAGGVPPEMRLAFGLGVLVSALTGYAAIAFLLRYLQSATLKIFIWYRIICGIIIVALAIFFRDPVMRL